MLIAWLETLVINSNKMNQIIITRNLAKWKKKIIVTLPDGKEFDFSFVGQAKVFAENCVDAKQGDVVVNKVEKLPRKIKPTRWQ